MTAGITASAAGQLGEKGGLNYGDTGQEEVQLAMALQRSSGKVSGDDWRADESSPLPVLSQHRASSAGPEQHPRHSDRSPIHSAIAALLPGSTRKSSSPVRPMSRW